jgi:hypothetical protein
MTALNLAQKLRVRAASGMEVVLLPEDARAVADAIEAIDEAKAALRKTKTEVLQARAVARGHYEKALGVLSEAIVHNLIAVGLCIAAVLAAWT